MVMEDVKGEVISTIAEALNVSPETLTDELSIGDIPEWDSVGNLTIITALEQHFGVEIPLEDLMDLTSVGSLVEEIKQLSK